MATSRSGTPSTYSFLVHSSSSSSHDASLSFDGSSTSKQKRRRTSPRDHAILETAYQKNSKPDKIERATIVSQVELGEKEVQIWFQNRRQNDRRKSKPLQPHELLAHIRNGLPAQTPTKLDPSQETETKLSAIQPANSSTSPTDIPRPSSRSSSIHELLNLPSSAESVSIKDNGFASSSQRAEPVSTPPSSFDETNKHESNQTSVPTTAENGEVAPKHSRKRSHDIMLQPSLANDAVVPPRRDTSPRPSVAKKSSFVRLAVTADGAVKVRTNNEPTPSPPKHRLPPPNLSARRASGITKSQSAVGGAFEFKDINPPVRRVGEAGFGRSRDARTWEFYCDRDSSDALSTQIEAERNGSAVGAINLIRSHSQRNKSHALSPNPARHNIKRLSMDSADKPRLARARSSMARLQSFDGSSELPENKAKRARHVRSSSGDSDKENWAPGTRDSHNPFRRMHPSAPRSSILQDSDSRHMRASTGDHLVQEVEGRPMVGKEKAKGDDLDCIQGLLSLSQGAWR